MNNDEFRDYVLSQQIEDSPWVPEIYHNKRRGIFELIVKPDDYYRETISENISLFRSYDTGEIIGCQVRNLPKENSAK